MIKEDYQLEYTDQPIFNLHVIFVKKKTSLDFYRFSHPDVIMHLKHLKQHLNEIKQLLHRFNILFNNMNNLNLL